MSSFKPRKSIVSRYSTTKVNSNYYGSVDIASGNATQDDVQVEKDKNGISSLTGWKRELADDLSAFQELFDELQAKLKREQREKKLKRILGDEL